jgi:hypothetical protein
MRRYARLIYDKQKISEKNGRRLTFFSLFPIDIDECADENTKCDDGKYCGNSPGSFACLECDKACSQCSGPGPENCTACNSGFESTDKGCEGITVE